MMLLLLFAVLIVLLFLGMDIGISMGVSSLVYLLFTFLGPSPINLTLIPQKMQNAVDSFPLMAIPLFILAGELMNRGGVTHRLVRFATAVVGHITGGLAQVTVFVNMIMAGMSGSAVADAAATGAVLIPSMVKSGFPSAFASAVTAAAGTLGPVIPPSIAFVIIGTMVDVSVGRLFLGGALPGIFFGLSMMAAVYWVARREGYPKAPRASLADLRTGIRDAGLALLMPFFVLGAIVSGITTPTEAAGVAVIYSLLLGVFVYREIGWRDVLHICVDTAQGTAAIMLTIATAVLFGWLATAEQMGPKFAAALFGVTQNKVLVLLVINIFLLLLGCLMEGIPIILILSPILFQIAKQVGVDPVHFGVMFTVNVMIGMVTPPIGLNLFVVSAISRTPVWEIARAAVPFMILMTAALMVITFYPPMTLWLPNLLMGK